MSDLCLGCELSDGCAMRKAFSKLKQVVDTCAMRIGRDEGWRRVRA